MTIEDEDQWIGVETHLVPKADVGEKCNAKKATTIQGTDLESADIEPELEKAIIKHNDLSQIRENENRSYFRGYCNNPAGKGTDHVGEGRCKFHTADHKGGGPPKHNQNGTKKSTTVDPHHYHEDLDPEEQEFIHDTTASILDRIRRNSGREPDFLDKILARRIAIDFHIVSKATEYSRDELVQVIIRDGHSHEETGALVEEVRRYNNSIISRLKTLGVLDDPESQKANSLNDWRNFLESGQAKESQKQ